MSETFRTIERTQYEAGRCERLTPDMLYGVGCCVLRLLTDASNRESGATERAVLIIHVAPTVESGYKSVAYMGTDSSTDEAMLVFDTADAICSANGYVVDHQRGAPTEDEADTELGYFTGPCLPPRSDVVEAFEDTAARFDELVAA